MTTAIADLEESSSAEWSRIFYAFLAEKERRSGSLRTVQSYSGMLNDFFSRLGKTPDEVTSQDAFAWAYGIGLSGNQPSSITMGARLGCLSSFHRFLIRMKLAAPNPCDVLERPRWCPGPPRPDCGADPPCTRSDTHHSGGSTRSSHHQAPPRVRESACGVVTSHSPRENRGQLFQPGSSNGHPGARASAACRGVASRRSQATVRDF